MSTAETPTFVRDYLARFDRTWSDDASERDIRFCRARLGNHWAGCP